MPRKIIDADALKNAVRDKIGDIHKFMEVIDEMPPAEGVEPITHGVWLYTEAEGGLKYWLCSNCRSSYHKKPPHDMRRCYYCGSYNKMQA